MLKSPHSAHIRSAYADILLRFAFNFSPFLFQTTVNPKHLYLKCVHFASLSIFLSHLRQSAQISGNPTVHIFKTPVRLAEKRKRNDPWRFAFAFSSGVISVRSYYLTSLVTSLSADCGAASCNGCLRDTVLSFSDRQWFLFEAEKCRRLCPWPKFPRVHRWIPFLFFVSFQSPAVRFFFGLFLVSLPCDYKIAQVQRVFKVLFCIYFPVFFCWMCIMRFYLYL